MPFVLRSTSFDSKKLIPLAHTAEGENLSPGLSWEGAPRETGEFALLGEGTDPGSGELTTHWVLYKIPGGVSKLASGMPKELCLKLPPSALHGKNSWGGIGYQGPTCSKDGIARSYTLRLYALARPLDLPPGCTGAELRAALEGCTLAVSEIIGFHPLDRTEIREPSYRRAG